MADIQLKCRTCGKDFVFTEGEQAYFANLGYTNQPKDCMDCRRAKKNSGSRPSGNRPNR